MIGADFDKIHFELFGLDLVEPMALVTDSILGILSIYLGWRISKIKSDNPFYAYWKYFFLIFGIGAFIGGFAHAFYNYWGALGKFPSWIAGPVSVYCLEQAMISLYPNEKILNRLKLISVFKLIIVFIAFFLVCGLGSIQEKPSQAFLPIAINTILGVSLTAGVLGAIYKKRISEYYRYFYLGVLIMLPSAFVFLLKINLHQWFDKNDLSHVLLGAGIVYFYIGVNKVSKFLNLPDYRL